MLKKCTSCGLEFEITENDLAFYKKVSPEFGGKKYDVPPPALCPDCRMQRRMAYRNERSLYERTCSVSGKKIIAVHPPESPYKVCDKEIWYSDEFDPYSFGKDIDYSRSFFDQFKELSLAIPLPSLRVERSENCNFNNDMSDSKNCYLCARTHQSENMMYCYRGNKSSDSIDSTQITQCELLHECVDSVQCYNGTNLSYCNECTDCAFCFDCRSCMSCFLCTNLRGKKYCFLNEQLSEEEYKSKIASLDLSSWSTYQSVLRQYEELKLKAIHRDRMMTQCEESEGDNLLSCKRCINCFGIQRSQDCTYVWDTKEYTDSMDAYSGGRGSELIYESTSATGSYGARFCVRAANCSDVLYSWFITASKNCFGCIGLRNAEYCIFNKQYSKEEYEKNVGRLIEHMKTTTEWGEFFPASLTPFVYNDTVANEYFPLSKEEAESLGYRWREKDTKIPNVEKVIQADQLPDSTNDIPDDVLNWALVCTVSKRPFKLQPQELKLYRDRNLPLPRMHPDVRHADRVKRLNPRKLWPRKCSQCSTEIQTTFAPDRPEIVYCEECYLNEVY